MKIENMYSLWECGKIKEICELLHLECVINITKDDDGLICYEIEIDINTKYEQQLDDCFVTVLKMIESLED